MVKLNLTDEEKIIIIKALNNNVEPPPVLMTKLFPGLAEKFDVVKLDRAKIVTLEYEGKRSEAAILNQGSPTDAGSPLQVERCFKGGSLTGETQLDLFEKAKDGTDNNWQNLIVQGDNLQFLKTCYQNADPLIKDRVKGKVKLIYIDPPFATKSDFKGSKDEKSYADKVDSAEFIEGLRERLIYLREILADDGSIYLHLDQKMSHSAKIVMDEVFGLNNFLNQITWQRTDPHNNVIKKFGTISDILLVYTKGANYTFNCNDIRMPLSKSALKEYSLIRLDTEEIAPYKEETHGRRLKLNDATVPSINKDRQFTWRGAKPSPGRSWPADSMEEGLRSGKYYLRNSSTGAARCKVSYLNDNLGQVIQDIWTNCGSMKGGSNYPTQKPETLSNVSSSPPPTPATS